MEDKKKGFLTSFLQTIAGKIIASAVGIALIALLVIVLVNGFSGFGFSLFGERRIEAHAGLLQEIRKMSRFNTAQSIYKTVFPHDFKSPDTDWRRLLMWRFQANQDGVEPMLTESETRDLALWDLAQEINFDITDPSNFVVITGVVKAGYDFSNLPVGELFSIQEDELGKHITMYLPEAMISDFYIQDTTSEEYEFPEVPMNPGGWAKIIKLVRSDIAGQVKAGPLLDLARQNAKSILTSILLGAGFRTVTITDQK